MMQYLVFCTLFWKRQSFVKSSTQCFSHIVLISQPYIGDGNLQLSQYLVKPLSAHWRWVKYRPLPETRHQIDMFLLYTFTVYCQNSTTFIFLNVCGFWGQANPNSGRFWNYARIISGSLPWNSQDEFCLTLSIRTFLIKSTFLPIIIKISCHFHPSLMM